MSLCGENTQGKIPRSARNDSLIEVFTQSPLGKGYLAKICAAGMNDHLETHLDLHGFFPQRQPDVPVLGIEVL